jgi:diguanylate cyclase (GGDEF)-like protein
MADHPTQGVVGFGQAGWGGHRQQLSIPRRSLRRVCIAIPFGGTGVSDPESRPSWLEKPEVAENEIGHRLHKVERRDWWLWGTAVLVMMLLASAVCLLSFLSPWRERDTLFQVQLDAAARGLVGLILLFSLFAIHQQLIIKRLRRELAEQMAKTAEVFKKLAVLDPLTGLYNRRGVTELLSAEIARADRQGYTLTALMLDLNGLKRINDSYGHSAGDLALVELARRLRKAIRSSDLPARVGGDEFLVLLPECTAAEVVHALDRLRGLEIVVSGSRIPVIFASGWVEYRTGESPEQFLERADQALYADKHRGQAVQKVEEVGTT